MPDPQRTFQENITKYQEAYRWFNQRYLLYSWLRVATFIGVVSLSGFCLYYRPFIITGVVLFVGIVIFGILVNRHKKIAFERRQREILVQINQEELMRLEGDLSGFNEGMRYHDLGHDFTGDMDIFGANSLFQLINRTTTASGQSHLADWMKTPAGTEEILERQAAVGEIKEKPEWNQNFIAYPRHKDHSLDRGELEVFSEWIVAALKGNYRARRLGALAVGLFSLVVMATIAMMDLSLFYLFIPGMIGASAVRSLQHEMLNAMEVSRAGLHLLETYELLARTLQDTSWESTTINRCRQTLESPGSALLEIRKLKNLFHTLSSRSNPLFALFNVFFAVDIYLLIGLEKWKARNAPHFSGWLNAISEMEALSGIAAYAYANPGYVVPEPVSSTDLLETRELGHPLISSEIRVCNDFAISNQGSIGVITGSNMSGKSTFLRTVGINLVLARMGAPVCAKHFRFSPMAVFSSMRTSDNLKESVSSFYAELQRIERLITMTGSGATVFFLLDEVLKGTNTEDRQLGARSLIRQLSAGNFMGLVSTHDISLGELADEMNRVTNYHFSSEVKDDNLIFDYKLHPGVCQSFNASELMAGIGIKLEPRRE